MVSLTTGDITVEVNQLTYSLKSKIGGYVNNKIDRSNMKLVVLLKTKTLFYITITKKESGHILYKVEIDSKALIRESEADLDLLYILINDFLKENPDATKFLMDYDYKIFAIADEKSEYIPYKLQEREILSPTISNLYNLISDMQKEDEGYFICAFPDMLFSVDKYTTLNLISILVKYYIEERFPVVDKKRYEESSIITLPAFSFCISHIKSLLKASFQTNYSLKNYYDNMSKMNLLPKIPNKSWWMEDFSLELNTNRLRDFIGRKKGLRERVKSLIERKNEEEKQKDEEEKEDKVEVISYLYIPEYFTHIFYNDNFQIMDWDDFLHDFTLFTGELVSRSEISYDIFNKPVIIVNAEGIDKIKSQDIIFFGFDSEKFYITLASKNKGKTLNAVELNTRNGLISYFWRKFGYEIEVVYEEDDGVTNIGFDNSLQIPLLDD